ncbi:hypothetical protein MMPV_008508 [Pyropia vietnamensis]
MLAESMGVPPPPSSAAEAAEWLNTALAGVWPFMAAYGSRVLATQGQAALSAALPAWLGTLTVAEVSLGAIPPRVGGVVVVPDAPAAGAARPPAETQADSGGDPGATTCGVDGRVDDAPAAARGVTVEADLVYAGDAVVSIDLNTPLTGCLRLGVRHLSLSGRLLLTACPLLPVLPLAGACSAAFVMPPVVGFDLTGWADVDRLPWVRSALTAAVRNVLGGIVVLPARLGARLDPSVDFFATYTPPIGILTFTLVAGRQFRPQRGLFFLADAPDVYIVAHVGATTAPATRTATALNTCSPVWHHTAAALVHHGGQKLELAVWEDDVLADDALGGAAVSVTDLTTAGEEGLWLDVEPAEPTGPPVAARVRKAAAAAEAAAAAAAADPDARSDEPPAVRVVGSMVRLVAAASRRAWVAPPSPPTAPAEPPAEGTTTGGGAAVAKDAATAGSDPPQPSPPSVVACLVVLIDGAPAGVAPAGTTVACRCDVTAPVPAIGDEGGAVPAGDLAVLHEWTTHPVRVAAVATDDGDAASGSTTLGSAPAAEAAPTEEGEEGGPVTWLRVWEVPLTAVDVASATLTVGLVIDGEPAGGAGGLRLDALAAAAGGVVTREGGGRVRWLAQLLVAEDLGRGGTGGDTSPPDAPCPDE